MSNKKGLTLIEVVVALSILALVFSGTVTLVGNATRLAMTAREKTMITAMAQKGIAAKLNEATFGCSSTISLTPLTVNPNVPGFSIEVTTQKVDYVGSGFQAGTKFLEINSRVLKNGAEVYHVKQYVRNK